MVNSEKWKAEKPKGNNAETFVKNLIESMDGWECIPYGIETHVNNLKETLKDKYDDTSRKLKSTPDFIAFNKGTKEAHIIEVKYRASKEYIYGYGYRQINNYHTFWKPTIIIMVYPESPFISIFRVEDMDIHDYTKNKDGRHKGVYTEIGEMKVHNWNFKDIEKDIFTLFPALTKEVIEKAIRRDLHIAKTLEIN